MIPRPEHGLVQLLGRRWGLLIISHAILPCDADLMLKT
jgi:hypothetical protein